MHAMHLTISVVVHHWNPSELAACLEALSESVDVATAGGLLATTCLRLSHNGPAELDHATCHRQVTEAYAHPFVLALSEPNLGYGGTNNRAIHASLSEHHDNGVLLVMNPDVRPMPDALANGLVRLRQDPRYGLVCPRILDWHGLPEPSIGHKRQPSIAVLFARLVPAVKKLSLFRQLDERYEYRDRNPEKVSEDLALCSGCFMLAREDFWRALDGFDERYFMYFEDFDLAARGRKSGFLNVYDPAVRVCHAGGGAGRKSWHHQRWFIRSAWRFFWYHGWRLWRV